MSEPTTPTEPNEQASKPAMPEDTVASLKAMVVEQQQAAETQPSVDSQEQNVELDRQDQAWQSYAGYGEYYQRVNAERVESGRIKINKFGPNGEVTMIAQIRIDPATGEVISGHDNNPEAQSVHDIEVAWQQYLAETSPEERFVVFEGDRMPPGELTDYAQAIVTREDSGQLQYLAQQAEVESTTGEPSIKQQTEYMVEKIGITHTDTALFFALRALAKANNSTKVPEDVAMHLHYELASTGVPGFGIIPEDQKDYLLQHPEELSKIKLQLAPFIDKWNVLLRAAGMPELIISTEGSVGFAGELTSANIMERLDPNGTSEFSKISRLNVEGRDQHIFDTIAEATRADRKPFVVYGGSHVVSLEPVMQEYYGNAQVLE